MITHLKIENNVNITEYIDTNILDLIYKITSGIDTPTKNDEYVLDNASDVTGNVTTHGIYKFVNDYLLAKYNKISNPLRINYNETYCYIKDPYIKSKLIENNFGDNTGNYVTYAKVFAATTLPKFGVDGYSIFETEAKEFTELGEFTNVTTLDGNFRRCQNIETVDLKNITKVAGAFYQSGIKHCLNSNNVKEIKSQAFENCSNLETFDFSSVELIEWNCMIGTKITEAHFNGSPNIVLKSNSMRSNTLLTTITGLENVTAIDDGYGTFASCSALQELRLDNCESIASQFVNGCSSLHTFYAPKCKTFSGSNTFSSCSSLENLTLDWEHMTTIPSEMFRSCSKLQSVDLSNVTTFNGESHLNRCANLRTITALNPNVTVLPKYIFYGCSKLESIDISNVNTLYDQTFHGNKELTSVGCDLSNITNLIGGGHFYQCESLHINADYSNITNTETLPQDEFRSSGIVSFNGGNQIKYIGDSSLNRCHSLTTVNCPAVISIDNYAMYDDTALTTVNCPNVKIIGVQAFYNCSQLTTIGNAKPQSIGAHAFYNTLINNIDLSECTTLGGNAFFKTKLTSIDLSNITTVSDGSQFEQCSDLTTVKWSNTLSAVPNYCFKSDASLQSVTNTGAMTSIGYQSFFQSGITTIDLSSIETIGENGLGQCTNLTNIGNTSNLKTLGVSNFTSSKITSINLENVESIGNSCFHTCSMLSSPIIMNKITSLGSGLFYNSPNIPYIVLNVEALPTKSSNAFGNQINGGDWPIYITDSLYDTALSQWSSTEWKLSERLKKLSTLPV